MRIWWVYRKWYDVAKKDTAEGSPKGRRRISGCFFLATVVLSRGEKRFYRFSALAVEDAKPPRHRVCLLRGGVIAGKGECCRQRLCSGFWPMRWRR